MTKAKHKAKWTKRLEHAQKSYESHDLAMGNCEIEIEKAKFELLLLETPLVFDNITCRKWARKYFEKYSLPSCLKALEYANRTPLKVVIHHRRWGEDYDNRYHIFPAEDFYFWLNSFSNKKQALVFCKAIGWKVVGYRFGE